MRTIAEMRAFGKTPTRPHACGWSKKYHAALVTVDCDWCGAKPGEGCRKVLAVGDLAARPIGSDRIPAPMYDAHRSRRAKAWGIASSTVHHYPAWTCQEKAA